MTTRLVALGEIATVVAGQSPPGSTYNESGVGLPFFQGKADFGESHPTAKKWCAAPRKVAEPGDILISVRAPVGPTNVAAERCCIGRGLAAIKPDETVVTRDFLLWAIKQSEAGLIAKSQGSTFPAIGQKDLKALSVPLPTIGEQLRIIAVLNRAAKIERLRAQATDSLREFVPALFAKMFGDPVENPLGWDIASLGDVIKGFQAGKNIRAGSGGRLRVLKVSAVTKGRFDPSMSKPLPDDYVAPDHHHVRVGDLLITRANTTALVGATALVEQEAPYVLLPDKVWRFVWQENSPVVPRFIHGLLQNEAVRSLIGALASGTGGSMKNISQAKLKTLPVIVPPLEVQVEYGRVVDKACGLLLRAERAATATSDLSRSLMERMLLSDGNIGAR